MEELSRYPSGSSLSPGSSAPRDTSSASLIDVLDRVLDKGVVIAGDIKINLLDIELLTIKVRLLIASADKAREMGIDWWAHDPELSSKARREEKKTSDHKDGGQGNGEQKQLLQRMERLESQLNRLLERSDPAGRSTQ